MKRYLTLLYFILAFHLSVWGLTDDGNDSLLERKNIGLKLYNPGTGGGFYVMGDLKLTRQNLVFLVYSDSSYSQNHKLYPFNHLVRDITIPYTNIKKVRRGCFLLIIPTKISVRTLDGTKFKFNARNRKQIIAILRANIKGGGS